MTTYYEHNERKPHFQVVEWDETPEPVAVPMSPLEFRALFLERYQPRPEDVVEWK